MQGPTLEAAAKAAELNILTSGDARTLRATPLAKQGDLRVGRCRLTL